MATRVVRVELDDIDEIVREELQEGLISMVTNGYPIVDLEDWKTAKGLMVALQFYSTREQYNEFLFKYSKHIDKFKKKCKKRKKKS